MKTIFENKYMCTKDYYKEYYKNFYFKKPSMIIINVILSISFVINMLCIIFPKLNGFDTDSAILNVGSILILICIEVYVYFKNLNGWYNIEQEIYKNKTIEKRILITDNEINIYTNSDKIASVELKNIERTIKTKNYYIIITKSKLGIAIKKNGFVNGTLEEFEKFVNRKRLKVENR